MKAIDNFHSRYDESSAKWELAKERKPEYPRDVVPMTVADMEFDLADEIKDGLKAFIDNNIPGYTRPWPAYYDVIIDHYKYNYDSIVKKDEIVPVIGVVPALFTAVKAFAKKGEGVIVFTPVYPQFYMAISKSKRKEVHCPLIFENGEYFIDFDLFDSLAKDKNNKLVILCSPHNPSGRIWSDEELDRLCAISKKHGLIIISDEIHADLGLYGNNIRSMLTFKEYEDMVVVMSSASKTYNLAGFQTANAIFKSMDLKAKYQEKLDSIGIHGPNALGLKATELAYGKAETWLDQVKLVIENNMKMTEDFFAAFGDLFKTYPTKSTYLAWVNFENFCNKYDLSPKEFCQFLDDNYFFVQPGVMFGKEAKYFIRINVALPSHKFRENLDRLERALRLEFQL